MTTSDKTQIQSLIKEQMLLKGLAGNAYARHIKINGSTINQLLNGKWDNMSKNKWEEIASKVGFKSMGWQLVETSNYILNIKRLNICKNESKILAVSHNAGAGKSFALENYTANNENVFYVQCAIYYTKKVFLSKLLQEMDLTSVGLSIADMVEKIVLNIENKTKPLIILDEFDKLKPDIQMLFISFENRLRYKCGFFIAGAPYLRLHIENYAVREKQGYKEILSRMGGKFLKMGSTSIKDVTDICKANGVTDVLKIQEIINKTAPEYDLRCVKFEIETFTIVAV